METAKICRGNETKSHELEIQENLKARELEIKEHVLRLQRETRKLCYRKYDRAMHAI